MTKEIDKLISSLSPKPSSKEVLVKTALGIVKDAMEKMARNHNMTLKQVAEGIHNDNKMTADFMLRMRQELLPLVWANS